MWRGILRLWVLCLALFELLPLTQYLVFDKDLGSFAVNLKNEPAEKRLWCVMIAFLMFSRLLAVASPNSRAVQVHLAAVHILELVYFFNEQKTMADTMCVGDANAIPKGHEKDIALILMRRLGDIIHCPGGGAKGILAVVAANALLFTCAALAPMSAPPKPPPAQAKAGKGD